MVKPCRWSRETAICFPPAFLFPTAAVPRWSRFSFMSGCPRKPFDSAHRGRAGRACACFREYAGKIIPGRTGNDDRPVYRRGNFSPGGKPAAAYGSPCLPDERTVRLLRSVLLFPPVSRALRPFSPAVQEAASHLTRGKCENWFPEGWMCAKRRQPLSQKRTPCPPREGLRRYACGAGSCGSGGFGVLMVRILALRDVRLAQL